MNDIQLKVYHQLPWWGRYAVASIRGAYLYHWRYGPESDDLVESAISRERWSKEEWKTYVQNRLSRVLHRAVTRVPYYRDHWAERRRRGDSASYEYLENWPILEKSTIRSSPKAFVADDCNVRRMYCEQTSGTTGTPLHIWSSKKTIRGWYALLEARWRRWYGVSRRDRWGILGGQLVTPIKQSRPPFWVWNTGLNQLYMSSYHLSPNFAPHYLEALAKYSIKYLWGYSSSLHALAYEALRLN